MIHFYKYSLRRKKDRENTDLRRAAEEIIKVLEDHFNKNLREKPLVYNNYFCFNLHTSSTYRSLRIMGHKLRKTLRLLGIPYNFLREPLELYGIVNLQENGEHRRKCAEFLEKQSVDLLPDYRNRALEYFRKSNPGNIEQINEESIILSYYLETAVVKDIKEYSSLWSKGNDTEYIKVLARHQRMTDEQIEEQHSENVFEVEENTSIDALRNRLFDIESNEEGKRVKDILRIHQVKKLRRNEIQHLLQSLEHQTIKIIDGEIELKTLLDRVVKDGAYFFRVRDVGQALATSLEIEGGNIPILYFDYGWPCDPHSKRPDVCSMPIDSGCAIILSHIHKDHWYGLSQNIDASKVDWFIPDQYIGPEFMTKVAEILAMGGNVRMIRKDVLSGTCNITVGDKSAGKIHKTYTKHETGLTMRLEARDGNMRFNILISGDQIYKYICDNQKRNVDMLVATHHGGKYYVGRMNNSRFREIPYTNGTGTVVYSYGYGNHFGHPGYVCDHCKAGWVSIHRTAKDGEYSKKIKL